MKNYFDFTLTGKKFLPVWLLYYFIYELPLAVYFYGRYVPGVKATELHFFVHLFFPLLVIGLLIHFLIFKIKIEHVRYGENNFSFNGRFWTFTGKVLLGMLLSVITLGIYAAWFVRDINRFFIDNSSRKGHALQFNGNGSKLFIIILLVFIIPIVLFALGTTLIFSIKHEPLVLTFSRYLFIIILAIPYFYLYYKWLIDIKYKEYHIHWNTEWMSAIGKIALEVFLSVITLGIYLPLAYLKLFAYFSQRTIAKKEDGAYVFGYDIEPASDFLFVWGQLLLTILTLGIYYPWAYTKIGKRILRKTYVAALNEH